MLMLTVLVMSISFFGRLTNTEDNSKNKNVIKSLSIVIAKKFADCDGKNHYRNGTITDFMNYWNTKWPLTHSELGCALRCIGDELQLVDGGRLVVPHARALLQAHDAGEQMISTMFDLQKYCYDTVSQVTPSTANICWFPLELARCLRDGIEDLNWNPELFKYPINEHYIPFHLPIIDEVQSLSQKQLLRDINASNQEVKEKEIPNTIENVDVKSVEEINEATAIIDSQNINVNKTNVAATETPNIANEAIKNVAETTTTTIIPEIDKHIGVFERGKTGAIPGSNEDFKKHNYNLMVLPGKFNNESKIIMLGRNLYKKY